MKDVTKLTFNNEEYEVTKIKIRQIGALAQTLNDLPDILKDFIGGNTENVEELDTQKMLELAPNLIMKASETVPAFLSVASGIELDKILDGGLDDLIELIRAVLEVNNFDVIVKNLRNLMKK